MTFLNNIRNQSPLIHCLTNPVGINDVANSLIALGASPIMAESIHEVTEITAQTDALFINMGMLHDDRLEAMRRSLKTATVQNIPIVLDPVGIGASSYRRKAFQHLIRIGQPTVIKGNTSEIATIAEIPWQTKGVDGGTGQVDAKTLIKEAYRRTQIPMCLTGKTDWFFDGVHCQSITSDTPLLGQITASGDMLGGILACTLACQPNEIAEAVTQALGAFKLASSRASQNDTVIGPGSFKPALFDELARLDSHSLQQFIESRKE